MRFCNQCHRLTVGSPLYCNLCGASYDVKLCPARHVNLRWADVCAECGSRDLSTPAPRFPFWIIPLSYLLPILFGIILLLLSSLVLLGLMNESAVDQASDPSVVLAVLIVSLLWLLYFRFNGLLRNLLRSGFPGTRKRNRFR
jgi:hypothetical protein